MKLPKHCCKGFATVESYANSRLWRYSKGTGFDLNTEGRFCLLRVFRGTPPTYHRLVQWFPNTGRHLL